MCCGMGPGSLVTGNGAWRTARPAKTECVYAGPSESVSLGRNAMRVGWAPLASKTATRIARPADGVDQRATTKGREQEGGTRAVIELSCGGQLS